MSCSSDDQDVHTRPPPKKPRKTRAVVVCNRCKSLKTKCDLERPCGNCRKAKVGSRCVYGDGEPAVRFDTPPPVTTSIPTTVPGRLSALESRFTKVEEWIATHEVSQGQRSFGVGSVNQGRSSKWQSLLASLPPKDIAIRLLRRYFIADTLFRYSHEPSMMAHFESYYPQAGRSAPEEHTAFFASITMAMIIGTLIEQYPESENALPLDTLPDLRNSLTNLYHAFIHLSETSVFSESPSRRNPEAQYYHLHAGLLNTQRTLHDPSSSAAVEWCEMGKVFHTGLLLGFHHDPTELDTPPSPFWCEMKRRLWWHLRADEQILAQRLHLPNVLPPYTTRKPSLIRDQDLVGNVTAYEIEDHTDLANFELAGIAGLRDNTQPGWMSEWAYVECKLAQIELISQLNDLRSSSEHPPGSLSLLKVNEVVAQFDTVVPYHLRFEVLASTQASNISNLDLDQPPWVLAQACTVHIGISGAILAAYQPYLTLPPDIPGNNALISDAFQRSINASQKLIKSSEAFVWHITIRWPEGRALFSWNLGMRIFLAGMTLALSAIQSGPTNPSWKMNMDHLTSAIGLMQVLVNQRGQLDINSDDSESSSADQKALTTLRQLYSRAKSANPTVPNETTDLPSTECDPYTFYKLPTPNPNAQEPLQPNSNLTDVIPEGENRSNFTLDDLETLLNEVYGSINV